MESAGGGSRLTGSSYLTVEGAPTASTEVSEAAKIGDVAVTANKQGA